MIAFGLVPYRVFIKAKLTIMGFNWKGIKINSSHAHKLDYDTFRVSFIVVALLFGGIVNIHKESSTSQDV